MTKERLQHFRALMNRVRETEKEIVCLDKLLAGAPYAPTVLQKVLDYPGTVHLFNSSSKAFGAQQRAVVGELLAKRRDVLKEQLAATWAEYDSLSRELDSVNDPLARQALVLRYREGLTWRQTAHRMPGNTPDSLRAMCKRYLAKRA